jgi:hypothetical protein
VVVGAVSGVPELPELGAGVTVLGDADGVVGVGVPAGAGVLGVGAGVAAAGGVVA